MKKDRTEICGILSKMLDSPSEEGIYPTTEAYDALEKYVEGVRVEAIGWTHADACVHLDGGDDYRKVLVPGILTRAFNDLA